MTDNDKLVMKMQRIRNIKPEFFVHEGLFDAEQESGLPIRLALAGLWTCCDKKGRFEWKPRQLKLKILPYDITDFANILDILAAGGYVIPYEVDGKKYGYIPTWEKHQYISPSEMKVKFAYPAPNGSETVSERVGAVRNGNVKGMERNGKRNENGNVAAEPETAQSHSQSQPELSSPLILNPQSHPQPEPRTTPAILIDPDNPDPDLDAQPSYYDPVNSVELAQEFYNILPTENQEQAPREWQRLWAEDFSNLLIPRSYELEEYRCFLNEVSSVIAWLPGSRAGQRYVRGKTFVEGYEGIRADWEKATKKRIAAS